jgi:hypothetical protein
MGQMATATLLTVLLAIGALAPAFGQGPAPAPPGSVPGVAGTPGPAGDEAAQRTIFGPTRRTTVVLGAVLIVIALGLFAAGLRRGPRAADPAHRHRSRPHRPRRHDRAA